MSEQTKIQWADSTINFWSGCTKVSPGCTNCYAEARDKRHMIEKVDHWGKGAPRLLHKGAVKKALALNRYPWICGECGHAMTEEQSKAYAGCPTGMHLVQHHRRRVFCMSLADIFDDEVPIEYTATAFQTISQCSEVVWMPLTKRPENWVERMNAVHHFFDRAHDTEMIRWLLGWLTESEVPNNIWLGTSCEDQQRADERIPELLKIPAQVRFLSCEPLLGPLNIFDVCCRPEVNNADVRQAGDFHLDWVIIGGESGKDARPCNVAWVRSLVAQCKAAGVAPFVKQIGRDPQWSDKDFDERWYERFSDPKGGDMSEWPADLRIRNFPSV